MSDLAARSSYDLGMLGEQDLAATWNDQFGRWLADAGEAGIAEPNAMTLATATPGGAPSARTVLLRGVDEAGFVFYSNFESRKGRELAANPRAALVFLWFALQRQVTVEGVVEPSGDEAADAYFANRPWRSQLGAIASPQSQVIDGRSGLERRHSELAAAHPEGSAIPRPGFWGGYRLVPECVEFWQGRRDRLHDRLRFVRSGSQWRVERLAP